MYSSGIKRGLAVSAVSALAITGIATSASAVDFDDQAPLNGAELISQSTGIASTKDDGQNQTVRLEAIADDTISNIQFTYATAAQPNVQVPIATVGRNDDGAFSTEWTVPQALFGSNVTIYVRDAAVALPADNSVQQDNGIEDSQATQVRVPGNNNATSVNVNTDNDGRGYFVSPYGGGETTVIVDGTSSDAGAIPISAYGLGATTTAQATAGPNQGDDIEFAGILDIAGYQFGTSNELAVIAQGTGGNGSNRSDDVEGYTLYRQTITNVTAVADRPNSQNDADVTVTVTDQNNQPIAGARVASSDNAGGFQLTDENGQAVFTQQAGFTTFYYADATGQAGFQAANNDKRSADVTVGNSQISNLVPNSVDGPAFDIDEYDSGDITVQAVDQTGGDFDTSNQTLTYRWVLTPFDGSPASVTIGPKQAAETGGQGNEGSYVVEFPTRQEILNAGSNDVNGTYQLIASLAPSTANGSDGLAERNVFSVKSGDAAVVLTPAGNQTANAGGQVTFTGSVELTDGTGLPNRAVGGVYTRGQQGTDTQKDAGFTPAAGGGLTLTRTYTTDANGEFTAVVDDPAETPQGTELGGTATFTFDDDDPAPSGPGNGTPTFDLADPSTAAGVDFAGTTPPATATVTLGTVNGVYAPGEVVAGNGIVTTPDSADAGTDPDPVAGQIVTLTTDAGYFTNGVQTTDPNDPNGTFQSQGQSIQVVTGANGVFTYNLVINRDQRFDEDGAITGLVTATAGSLSDTEDVAFSTDIDDTGSAPIFGYGSLDVALSDEQDGETNPARVGEYVNLDLSVTDGFGNLVGSAPVLLDTDSSDDVDFESSNGLGDETDIAESDYENDGDAEVTSTEEDEITVDGEILNGTAQNPGNGTGITDELDLSFEDVNLDTATITSDPEGEVETGTAVTETLTVLDDNGDPAQGVSVNFRVTAPNGSASEFTRTTNADGEASIVVVAADEGTYTVTAQATDGTDTLSATDTIVATDGTAPPARATLRGVNNGAKNDRLTVRTNSDANAVKLFRVANGNRVLIKSALNDGGPIRFTVRDRNGRKNTRYIATVGTGQRAIDTNSTVVR